MREEIFTVSLSGRGTPGHGRVRVAALAVLHPAVGEGEHAGGPSLGGAGVGDSLAETEASQPHSVMAGSSSTEQNRLTVLQRTPVVGHGHWPATHQKVRQTNTQTDTDRVFISGRGAGSERETEQTTPAVETSHNSRVFPSAGISSTKEIHAGQTQTEIATIGQYNYNYAACWLYTENTLPLLYYIRSFI